MDGWSIMTDAEQDQLAAGNESDARAPAERREMRDFAVGDPAAVNPLEGWSWAELRDEIYGEWKGSVE
jgi:hypothetical protein